MPQTEIDTEIHVAAPPRDVWRVLTDLSAYRQWNPMVTAARGEAVEGGRAILRYRSSLGLPLRFAVRITRSETERELRWVGSSAGITGDHYFRLEPEDGGTRLIHGEIFRGPLAGVLGFVFRAQIPVFERFNRALKEVAEARSVEAEHPIDGTAPSRR